MRTDTEKKIFQRTSLLVGDGIMEDIGNVKVILFGVGGVGSWCAEGLVRGGVRHLTLVDSDCVCLSNVNRQDMATTRTVGQPKVDALKDRLKEINPDAEITTIQRSYNEECAVDFSLGDYDYIIDAIDSLKDKISLIVNACRTEAKLFSAMGAALKVDPTKIKVADFWKVRGCPLGFALRKKMRRSGAIPEKGFLCVYDEEVLTNLGSEDDCVKESDTYRKAVTNGTFAHITAIFGFTLCGLVLQDIYNGSTSTVI